MSCRPVTVCQVVETDLTNLLKMRKVNLNAASWPCMKVAHQLRQTCAGLATVPCVIKDAMSYQVWRLESVMQMSGLHDVAAATPWCRSGGNEHGRAPGPAFGHEYTAGLG
jgi:hypothetical protein